MCLAMFILASSVSTRANEEYRIVSAELFEGRVILVDDSEATNLASTTAVVKAVSGNYEGKRFLLRASGEAGFFSRKLSFGDSVRVSGFLKPIKRSSWNKSRHLVGELSVHDVSEMQKVSGIKVVPEYFRNQIIDSSKLLPFENQALYLGLVIGEDSGQSISQKAQFRASGMTHLLAVSGQNVALVFAFLTPLFQRLPLSFRFPTALLVLVIFAVITRLEPSVLRACTVAGIAAWASVSGARSSGFRILCLALIILVLVDPFLIYSVGFQLSVIASAGILLFSEPLIKWFEKFRLPRVLNEAVSVTLAAQFAVLPLLIFYFGDVSLGSIPANVLAGFLAGLVMIAGSSLGLFVGYLPNVVGSFVMKPVDWALLLLELISEEFALLNFPRVSWFAYLVLVLICFISVCIGRRLRTYFCLIAPLFVILFLTFSASHSNVISVQNGFIFIPADDGFGSVLILNSDVDKYDLDDYIKNGYGEVDLIISESGTRNTSIVVQAFYEVGISKQILAPPLHDIPSATRVTQDSEVETSAGLIALQPDKKNLGISMS